MASPMILASPPGGSIEKTAQQVFAELFQRSGDVHHGLDSKSHANHRRVLQWADQSRHPLYV